MIYYNFWRMLFSGKFDWYSAPVFGLLVDESSTYQPDINHVYLADLFRSGLKEIEDQAYHRAEITRKALSLDLDPSTLKVDCFSLNFGRISPGKKIKAVVIYCVIDSEEFVIAYLENLKGLPATTDGGSVLVVLPNGLLEITVVENGDRT